MNSNDLTLVRTPNLRRYLLKILSHINLAFYSHLCAVRVMSCRAEWCQWWPCSVLRPLPSVRTSSPWQHYTGCWLAACHSLSATKCRWSVASEERSSVTRWGQLSCLASVTGGMKTS